MSRNLTTLLERAVRIRRLIGNELKNGGSHLRLLRLRRILLLLERRFQDALYLRNPGLVAIPAAVGSGRQIRRYQL